ncbi:MAG: hypothetical protein ACRDNM_04850 [Gaiellaceae bacterium]
MRLSLRVNRRARLGIRRYVGSGAERQIVVRFLFLRIIVDRG